MLQNIIEATYKDDFFGTPTFVFLQRSLWEMLQMLQMFENVKIF
jgi:hypothetical protein